MASGESAVGGLMQLGGTWLSANAAAQAQRKLDEIIKEPGVDVGSAYGDTLRAIDANQAGAERTATATNKYNQSEMDRLLNESIPGWSELQAKRSSAANSFLSGSLPPDVEAAVRRGSVGRAIEGGYGGSPAGRNLEARDLGLTSLDLINRGAGLTSDIVGSTPMARMMGSNDILNVSGKDLVGVRSKERSEKLQAMLNRAIAPGKTAVWGMGLQQQGKSMSESGAAGGGMDLGSMAGMAGM